jgi:hypothetical protein
MAGESGPGAGSLRRPTAVQAAVTLSPISSQPLFEQAKPVVTPERFVREREEGHAEHVVRGCLFLAALVGGPAFPSQIFEIVPVGQAKFRNQPSHGFRLIGF